ncbi:MULTISPECIES: glycosyltransferase family 4 protein [Flavobacterium]|uniref:Glycosyltransferase family 4 protein n=1 Tax=Flavobacterium algoritolerans TaxID=3041254 RepID=A0ABT6VDS9_9FLAO|nr:MULTISPECIES: glycosyltransferase family 4 protein [Flavobacterium]MDI5887457.1 glycosyltransferase family 4 protein [Flavobacterium yafengii]MDI5895623.1 glycosyltransferase family 4 protein [Flavobacterium algoritolerans]
MRPKILLHPDFFYTGHSGAIAAREAARQLDKLGYDVNIFTHDKKDESIATYPYFRRIEYRGKANYFPKPYKDSFLKVLSELKPDYVFFIGGIVNVPLVYIDLCVENNIKTAFLFLAQDFFCARFHAALGTGVCTKCLDGSNFNAISNSCLEKHTRPTLFFLNYQLNQVMFLPRIRKIDFVLGSSDEQLHFYEKIGIKKSNIFKIPLFFDQKRVHEINLPLQPYFVIIAQYRHEKGIHLISKILDYIESGITVKALFFNDDEAQRFLENYPENKKHVESKMLEILPNVTMTTGAVELISGSKGVINPSIWSTTTEFVLLEVLGMSKPVITFDVGIHKEVIINRVNGICIKAGDFQAMGDEINNLSKDILLQESISRKAKDLYHELTDETSFVKVLTSIFR